ncbi:MAG: XdhC family protein [Acidimicrobiia bacterium]
MDRGHRAALLTIARVEGSPPSRVGLTLSITDEGEVSGTLGCDGFDRSGASDGVKAIEDGRRFEAQYDWDDGSFVVVDVRPFAPGDEAQVPPGEIPELLVVGGGPVARALVALGDPMGFRVRVAAGPEPPSVGEFADAEEVILTPDARAVEALRPGLNTYVVICGHDDKFHQPVLRALLPTEAPYLGMMGSRRHTGHLLEELRASGLDDDSLRRVHSPVGIDIGAETPEEIALSALAQIVEVRRTGVQRVAN